jgi:hypothetical protein
MTRLLALLLLAVMVGGQLGQDEAPPVLTAQPLFDLDEELLRGSWTSAELVAADVSGDGPADLVLAGRHVSGEGPASVAVWILERRGDEFVAAYRNTWAAGLIDVSVGDGDDDGQDEVVVLVGEWQPAQARVAGRLFVIGRARDPDEGQPARYSVEWSSEPLEDFTAVGCFDLPGPDVVALGGYREVRFFGWTGSRYAEVADRRIDLMQLVPEGYEHQPGFSTFGPGIGAVEGMAVIGAGGGSQLAIAARDRVSDTGGGAVVVLHWQEGWQVEALLATRLKPQPNGLAAGDVVPGGGPEVVVRVASDMWLAEQLILFESAGGEWVERWRRGRTGEAPPNLGVGGLAFANGGRTLAIGANRYEHEAFESAGVELWQWVSGEGLVEQVSIPCDGRLLALAVLEDWRDGQDSVVAVQEGGIGSLILVE